MLNGSVVLLASSAQQRIVWMGRQCALRDRDDKVLAAIIDAFVVVLMVAVVATEDGCGRFCRNTSCTDADVM